MTSVGWTLTVIALIIQSSGDRSCKHVLLILFLLDESDSVIKAEGLADSN